MKIVAYDGEEYLPDIEGMMVMIKAVPYEGTYAPALIFMSPNDGYVMDMDELNALMDGIEIASKKIDEIVDYIIRNNLFKRLSDLKDDIGNEDEDDTG
jgi:hypothetical protein